MAAHVSDGGGTGLGRARLPGRAGAAARRTSLLPLALALLVLSGQALAGCERKSAARPVLEAQWQELQLINRERARLVFHDLARGPGGSALALWQREDEHGQESLWASWRVPGRGWQPPEMIEYVLGRAGQGRLAVNPAGEAVAVWKQADGRSISIWSNRFAAAQGWGAAHAIEFSAALADEPQVAYVTPEQAIALWMQPATGGQRLWSAAAQAGERWSKPQSLDNGQGEVLRPQLAVNGQGGAVAVWEQRGDGRRRAIFAAQLSAAGAWGAAQQVAAGQEAVKPHVALNAAGQAMLVWQQVLDEEETIMASGFQPGVGWGPPRMLEAPEQEGYAPRVALAADGAALAVWLREEQRKGIVWAARFTPAEGWRAPRRIQAKDNEYAFAPVVALNAAGDGLAVWYQSDVEYNNIWASRFDRATDWTPAEQVEQRAGFAHDPRVFLAASGGFNVSWKIVDGLDLPSAWDSLWLRELR